MILPCLLPLRQIFSLDEIRYHKALNRRIRLIVEMTLGDLLGLCLLRRTKHSRYFKQKEFNTRDWF